MNQQLTIGRIVHVYVDPRSNNGSAVCPAILTHVWGDGLIGDQQHPFASVNMRLMLDHSSNDPATNEWRTSCQIFASQDALDAYLTYSAEQSFPKLDDVTAEQQHAAKRAEMIQGRKRAASSGFMPPRV